jgi:anhydro-N-acetylmuramic acid kinase
MTAFEPTTPLYLGLMSGTSADGIDAALVQFPRRAAAASSMA